MLHTTKQGRGSSMTAFLARASTPVLVASALVCVGGPALPASATTTTGSVAAVTQTLPAVNSVAATTATVTVKAATQRMSGGSLKSRLLGTLPSGYRTTAGCRIIGQTHRGYYGTSNLWWDTPVGWLPDADVLGSVAVPSCTTRRAVGAKEAYNTAPYGQCTWKAKDMFRRSVGASPALYGNAKDWLNSARDAGYTTVLDAPLSANAIVVFQPGVQGAGSVGHVAWVLSTQQRTDGRYITIVEHNWMNQGAVDHTRTIKDVVGMSYILAG